MATVRMEAVGKWSLPGRWGQRKKLVLAYRWTECL